jgi:hypothetical protein
VTVYISGNLDRYEKCQALLFDSGAHDEALGCSKVVILLFRQHFTKQCQPANEPLVRHAAESRPFTEYTDLFYPASAKLLLRLTSSGLA